VGSTGTGSVDIEGAVLNVTGATQSCVAVAGSCIGQTATGTGTVTVNGPGAQFNTAQNFTVGGFGTGILIISNGATVTTTLATPILQSGADIGLRAGSSGAVTVNGAGAPPGSTIWTINSSLNVGRAGTGTLTIENGGRVVSSASVFDNSIGDSTSGVPGFGTVTVNGPGSTWTITDSGHNFVVGATGAGVLIIENGGTVSDNSAIIGSSPFVGAGTGTRTVTVDGAGSTWNTGTLSVRNGGVLTIANGGLVNSGSVTVGSGTSTGTLNTGAGLGAPPAAPGTLNTASVALSSSGTINFNHTATD
jgi:T5SS/PEP-CTERM-associated repeat protein